MECDSFLSDSVRLLAIGGATAITNAEDGFTWWTSINEERRLGISMVETTVGTRHAAGARMRNRCRYLLLAFPANLTGRCGPLPLVWWNFRPSHLAFSGSCCFSVRLILVPRVGLSCNLRSGSCQSGMSQRARCRMRARLLPARQRVLSERVEMECDTGQDT